MAIWGAGPTPTIGVDLWGHQVRGGAPNSATLVRPAAQPKRSRDLQELFTIAYRAFADRCREVDEPGVAIVAVHEQTGRAQGIVTLRARVERHVAAIIGRHDKCDLYLDASEDLALRHLAVIVDPVTSWKAGDASARFRVLDLRTSNGFTDEQGRTLRGIRCEGPALLRCAGHALFLLPLGDPSDWPGSAAEAWGFLPERVYFDELVRVPEGSLTHMPARSTSTSSVRQRKSMIFRTHGPRDSSSSLIESGVDAGTLDLIGPNLAGQIRIGRDELRDGVLIGRYARCDSAQYTDDPSMSRVHALMIQIGERVLVIDTASVNGTRLAGEHRSRVLELTTDTDLQFGKTTRARWRLA
jgi:hypothetical protein